MIDIIQYLLFSYHLHALETFTYGVNVILTLSTYLTSFLFASDPFDCRCKMSSRNNPTILNGTLKGNSIRSIYKSIQSTIFHVYKYIYIYINIYTNIYIFIVVSCIHILTVQWMQLGAVKVSGQWRLDCRSWGCQGGVAQEGCSAPLPDDQCIELRDG